MMVPMTHMKPPISTQLSLRNLLLAADAGVALIALAATAQTSYTITNLGVLPGHAGRVATRLNDRGDLRDDLLIEC